VLRESSLLTCLKLRTLPALNDPDFVAALREAGLVVLHHSASSADLATVCVQIRRQTQRPLAVLTAGESADEDQTVAILAAGADECLPASTSPAELVARLRAQLRRDREYSAVQRGVCYEIQGLTVDTGSHEVAVDGRRVDLTPKEFQLLAALAAGAGRPLRREDLLQEVWGYGRGIATRTLDVHIGRLRQKVERNPARPRLILTVPGVGYKLALGP